MRLRPRARHKGALLWNATHEANDYETEWHTTSGGFDLGGRADSGTGVSVIDSTRAHTGTYSLKMTTNAVYGAGEPGARNFRWADTAGLTLPDEAVYETWFYFDQDYAPVDWWNIFQFKTRTAYSTSDPDWSINVYKAAEGMRLYWFDHHRNTWFGDSGAGSLAHSTWHRCTVQYRFHPTNGLVIAWLNGVRWYYEAGIATMGAAPYTDFGFEKQWSINNYTSGNVPAVSNIWADDVSIRAV